MSKRIIVTAGGVSAEAELNDSPCAEAIRLALPIASVAATWGEEVYFDIGVQCDLAKAARAEMAVGELGYWPTGRALCIFFGRTPASGPDGAPRAASAVNPVGRIVADATVFEAVRDGQEITVAAHC